MSEEKLGLNEDASYLLEKIINRSDSVKHQLVLHMLSTAILKEQNTQNPGARLCPAEHSDIHDLFLLYNFLHQLSKS